MERDNIEIITNKKPPNLLRDNGHDYRLMELIKCGDSNIKLTHIDDFNSGNNNVILDIPGLSFRKYRHLVKLTKMNRKVLFIQDSFFRYSISRLIALVRNKYDIKSIPKVVYHVVYSFINELLISLFFHKIGVVSSNDIFLPFFFKHKYFIVKNGISAPNYQRYSSVIKAPIRLFFWGNMNYPPNKDSFRIFIKNDWSNVRSNFKDIELHIYGRYAPDFLQLPKELNVSNIFLHGPFDSLEELFIENDIFINFVQYGAGIKNKTLESLACGIPMICTQHALEGISQITDYQYTYSKTEELVESIRLITANFDVSIANNNALIITDNYTWDNAYSDYTEGFKE
jgi:glycosyltransferase involved in cell wall biosynthesis